MGQSDKDLEDAGVDRIQINVMDGNFEPNLTFGPEMKKACRKYCNVAFETKLVVSQYDCETKHGDYVEGAKGTNGDPAVVIADVQEDTHRQRVVGQIERNAGEPIWSHEPTHSNGNDQ